MEEQPHPLVEAAFWSVPVLLGLLGIFVALSSEERLHPLLHLCGSALLSFLLLVAAVWRPHWGAGPFPRAEFGVVGAVVGLGVGIEILQEAFVVKMPLSSYLPGSLGDLALDAIGAAIGWLCWHGLRSRSEPAG